MENKLKVVLIFLFLLISPFVFAATDTEIQYPTVPGAPTPTATTTFPEYVKYLFNFSIIIVGLIVFAVLIWAGILYLTSTGDPNKISEAKSKATGAFLGLLILLSSYLILTNINPQLTGLTIEPVPPLSGIYLISNDTPPKKTFVGGSNTSISFKNADKVEFVSATSSLMEVYLYNGEGFTGIRERVTASSTLIILSGAEIKSIYFLWNNPGVYLYDRINFQLSNNTPYPVHVSGLISNLGSIKFPNNQSFDNKARSLKSNPLGTEYGAVLFTDLDFRGQCAYTQDVGAVLIDVNNLSVLEVNYIYIPIGLDTLSSLAVFNYSNSPPGSVTFYDKENCLGNKKTYTIPVGFGEFDNPKLDEALAQDWWEGTFINLDRNILSFEINGNFAVVLATEQLLGGKCQLFFKPQTSPCYPSLKGSNVYDPDPAGVKVRSLMIISLFF